MCVGMSVSASHETLIESQQRTLFDVIPSKQPSQPESLHSTSHDTSEGREEAVVLHDSNHTEVCALFFLQTWSSLSVLSSISL